LASMKNDIQQLRKVMQGEQQRDMGAKRFLVTGAQGCIGAWVSKTLLELGHDVTAYDIGRELTLLSRLIPPESLKRVDFVFGDVSNYELLQRVIEQKGITHVIHLAGLMTPACKAQPLVGARVNVMGTLTILEAIRAHREQIECIAYASSAAVLGPDEEYDLHPVPDSARPLPSTLYGVYKRTTEDCARIYWEQEGIRSVGLRPGVVYGPGRETGLSAGPTLAVKAALLGQECEIAFGGSVNMQYVGDVARSFCLSALEAPPGALVCNMNGQVLDVETIIAEIEALFPSAAGRISYRPDERIGLASHVDDSTLQSIIGPFEPTTFREGIERTAAYYRRVCGLDGQAEPQE